MRVDGPAVAARSVGHRPGRRLARADRRRGAPVHTRRDGLEERLDRRRRLPHHGRMEPQRGLDSTGVPYNLDGLRSMSDAQLDAAIRVSNHSLGAGDILDELARREAAKQTATLVTLTWVIAALTLAVAVFTAILLLRT
jgi:hypothetical protein